MGDFTDWAPAQLATGRRGWWTITLPIPAGTHRMNLRVDGGAWGVPPGLPVLTDEFSGTTALLTVE
jgi:1,4-alpha-glucan branching enzyme